MTELKEFELQTRFINENADILQKYLIWKESEQIEAVDAEATMLDKLMNLPGLNQTTDQE